VIVQKYLGVLIDYQLDWSAQVSNVSRKMSYLFWIKTLGRVAWPSKVELTCAPSKKRNDYCELYTSRNESSNPPTENHS